MTLSSTTPVATAYGLLTVSTGVAGVALICTQTSLTALVSGIALAAIGALCTVTVIVTALASSSTKEFRDNIGPALLGAAGNAMSWFFTIIMHIGSELLGQELSARWAARRQASA